MGQFGWHFDLAAYVLGGQHAEPSDHVAALLEHEMLEVLQAAQSLAARMGVPCKLEEDETEQQIEQGEDKLRYTEDPLSCPACTGRNRDRHHNVVYC